MQVRKSIRIMWFNGKSWQRIIDRVTALPISMIMRPQKRGRLSAPLAVFTTEQFQQLVHFFLARQMLGEDVSGVHLPVHLLDNDGTRTHFLLQPQSARLYVPQLPEARPRGIPIAALESVQARTGNRMSRSCINDWCPNPAPAAFTSP